MGSVIPALDCERCAGDSDEEAVSDTIPSSESYSDMCEDPSDS